MAAEAASKRSDKGLVPEEVRLGRYLLVNPLEHSSPNAQHVRLIFVSSSAEPRRACSRPGRNRADHLAKQALPALVEVPAAVPEPAVCKYDLDFELSAFVLRSSPISPCSTPMLPATNSMAQC